MSLVLCGVVQSNKVLINLLGIYADPIWLNQKSNKLHFWAGGIYIFRVWHTICVPEGVEDRPNVVVLQVMLGENTKMFLMRCWKMVVAFVKPKGMKQYSKWPQCVQKGIFHLSLTWTCRRLYAPPRLILVNIMADHSWSMRLEIKGRG